MKSFPHLSEAEWEIMKIVWQLQPCSAQEIVDKLAPARAWTPSTIKTLVNRLLRKKALRFKKNGKAYLYSAAWTEEQCRTRASASFLQLVFNGAVSPMLAHFVRSHRLSPEDLRELERILKAQS